MNKKNPYRLFLLVSVLLLVAALITLFRSVTSSSGRYDFHKLEMLPRFAAKEYCSCLYVVQQTEGYCLDFINPKVRLGGRSIHLNWLVRTEIVGPKSAANDPINPKSTRSSVLGFYPATAQFDPNNGCRLVF